MTAIPNILAERYASDAIREIWSPEGKIVLEREFWIAVLKAQQELGLEVPANAIAAYEKASQVCESLAGTGAGFDQQPSAGTQRIADRYRHFLLRRSRRVAIYGIRQRAIG